MLKSLLIKNYALIQQLEMNPSAHLNIITGETGAGKSIMLGAIGLLLGNRADSKALFNLEDKCIVEACFDIEKYDLKPLFEEEDVDYDSACIVRREINTAGKSRAFVNDSPVNLDFLKKLGSRLMDVHSQHETLLLGSSGFQLAIIDAYASNQKITSDYRLLYKNYKSTKDQYELLLATSEETKKQWSYNSFLLNELLEASLVLGEQEKLETELKLLENAEEIKSKLNSITQVFSGEETNVLLNLQTTEKMLSQIMPYNEAYQLLHQRLKASLAELRDIQEELESEEAKVEFGNDELERVQDRLSVMYTLLKKHHVQTVEQLLAIQHELDAKVSAVENLDEQLETLQKETDKLYKALLKQASLVSESRKQVFPRIKQEIEYLLKEVGIVNGTIQIVHKEIAPIASGMDEVSILFSANKGIAPQELKNAASGGEFSRLMLCIKYLLADKTELPTIVFDEIDTGISGEIAIKVGKMMKQMSQKHQVVSISHLPQIAAQGDEHYFVYKDDTSDKAVSKVKKLTQEERVTEIAQMLSGAKPTASAIENAKELLNA